MDRIPSSADAARALTQVVLQARLCNRYHELASYASEPLKQRIHFLTRPDGSNLQELFIWDVSPALSASSTSPTSPSCSSAVSWTWTPSQFNEYVQQNWSADQWPLSPPNIYKSWEMTPVYYKALDPHTVHAFIPIGQAFATATATGTYLEQDHELEDNLALIMMVLMLEQTQEQERHQLETFKDQTIWKYHSMTLFKKSDLQAGSHGWLEMTDNDQFSLPYTAALDQRIHNGQCDSEHEQNGSDDDYWGQYGDMDAEEDEEKENPSGRVDTPLDGQESSAQMSTNGQWHGQVKDRRDLDTEDDEDDYWVKYAEQQQEQEASERKRRLQQQQQQPEQQQDVALFSREDDGDAERSKPFQIDPAQLASLIQMYITQGTTQPSSPSIQEPSVTLGSSVTPAAGLWSDHGVSMTVASSSKSKIMDALRVVKQEASRSGYSKEEVLEMLDSIYEA